MPEHMRITLAPPSGRAMLAWEGKHPLTSVAAPPVRLIETFGISYSQGEQPTDDGAPDCLAPAQREPAPFGLLLHGDNLGALAHLLANGYRGAVKLVYIDPPFDTGAHYARRVRLRGPGGAHALDTRRHKAGRQPQYADVWADDSYLQFMYERLILLRELLAEDGSLWLHCDHRRAHHLRLMLDEVFGAENYLNTISWRSQTARGAKVNAFYFPFSTHYLEIYGKNKAYPTTWNPVKKQIVLTEAEAAREFMRDERGFFRTSDPGAYSFESLKALCAEGRLYAPYAGQVVVDEAARRVYASNGGNIGVKYYLRELGLGRHAVERAVDNLWDDIPGLGTTPGEDLGYPTQKTEALLRRIITASTHPGDLVLDCFVGSGTTAAVAHKLGRRWIGCDSNPGAIQTSARRMQMIGRRTTDDRRQMTDVFPSESSYAIYRIGEPSSAGQPTDHPPAQARVAFERVTAHGRDELRIRIDSYDSPAVAERLADSAGHAPRIEDWRSLVDSVVVDPAYDGRVLRIDLSDAPAKKADLVCGNYTLPAPAGETTVAVRITDVLGEETLVIRRA